MPSVVKLQNCKEKQKSSRTQIMSSNQELQKQLQEFKTESTIKLRPYYWTREGNNIVKEKLSNRKKN